MKRVLLAAVSVAAFLTTPVFAADMPVKAAPVSAPLFNWTGFYAGADIGGVWAKDQTFDPHLNDFLSYSFKSDGIIGGGILGYNIQANQLVYGVEVDLGGLGLSKTIGDPISGHPPVTTNHLNSGFYGDVTGRLGLAFDRTLVYLKGGWAFYDADASVTNTGGSGGGTATSDKFFGGWTIGGGLECAFAPGWSAKVEYLHFDFGNETATLIATGPPIGTHFPFPNKLTADAVTAGLIYHFGH